MSLTFKKSARQAAAEVLDRAKRPLKVSEIAERTLRQKGVELSGETPAATIAAILSTENAKGGLFERVAPGTYRIRKAKSATRASQSESLKRPWTAREDRQVLAQRVSDAELAKRLQRTPAAIASRRHTLRHGEVVRPAAKSRSRARARA